MNKELVEFGKRMDSAQDKDALISFCEGAKNVLDLGSGTGAMARAVAEKYGCEVDAVDLEWKTEYMPQTSNGHVCYHRLSIAQYVRSHRTVDKGRYDRIILSGIIHELNPEDFECFEKYFPEIMSDNCRILIREPFWDHTLGPVVDGKGSEFAKLVSNHVSASKMLDYGSIQKKSSDYIPKNTLLFWVNLAFVLSYGEDSWKRESKEYRYAYSLDWCKEYFNFEKRPYTGFQVYSVLDTTYREHFINAGIPGEAFDLIGYTGMHVIIDYSK